MRGLFLIVTLLLPLRLMAQTAPATQPAVTVSAELGYGGVWRAGTWTPIATRFSALAVQEAWLEISAEAAPGRVLRTRQRVTLSPVAQTVQSLLPVGFAAQEVRVKLTQIDTGATLAQFAYSSAQAAALVPVANERLAVFYGTGASNAASSLSFEVSITAAADAIQRLPAVVEPLLGVDAIVLLSPGTIEPDAIAAMLAWVRLGGELIVVAGETPLPMWLEEIAGAPLGAPQPRESIAGVRRELPGTIQEIEGDVKVARHPRDRGAITFVNADPTSLPDRRGRQAWLKILEPAIAGRMSAAYRDPVHQPLSEGVPLPKPSRATPWLLIAGLSGLLAIDGLMLSRRRSMRLVGGLALAISSGAIALQLRQGKQADMLVATLIEQSAAEPLLRTDLIYVAAGETQLTQRPGWWSVAAADELNRSGYSELFARQTQTANPPGSVFVSDGSMTTLIGRSPATAAPLRLAIRQGELIAVNASESPITDLVARLPDGRFAQLRILNAGETATLPIIDRLPPYARNTRLLDTLLAPGQGVVVGQAGERTFVRATISAE